MVAPAPCPVGHRCRVEGSECRYALPGRCALAVAARRAHTLVEIGALMGLSPAQAGDVLKSAMRKLRAHSDVAALAEFLRDD